MSDMSVGEVAAVLNVDQSYVRKMLRSGDLRGRHIGHFWLVPAESVSELEARRVGAGRPLAPRRAWALLEMLDGGKAAGLSSVARSQVRAHIRRLHGSDARTWRAALRGREDRRPISGHRAAIARLSDTEGVWPTGLDVAASMSNLLVVKAVPEFYISGAHWERLADELRLNLLASKADAYVRIPRGLWPYGSEGPGRTALAASLLDNGDARSAHSGVDVLNDLAKKVLL